MAIALLVCRPSVADTVIIKNYKVKHMFVSVKDFEHILADHMTSSILADEIL